MHFLVNVETEDDGTFRCVVSSGSEFHAARVARTHYTEDGYTVVDVEAEMFNTYEHGTYEDYEQLS
jgi:hypothetical protein